MDGQTRGSGASAVDDALSQLRQRIEKLHVHKGAPSTRMISARTGRAISHTTVHGVLRCTRLPTWGQLELVVEQLGGDVEEFRQLWIRARNAQQGIFEADETGAPESAEDETPGQAAAHSELRSGNLSTQPISELFVSLLDNLEQIGSQSLIKVSTGHYDLDMLLGAGLTPGQLFLIAGRPSIGKSTLALNMCRATAVTQGFPALLMSFRLTKEEVLRRFLAAEARVPLHVLRAGRLSEDDWTRLARRLGEIHDAPLFINDSYTPSMAPVTREIRRAVTEHDVKLVVIDSVQQLLAHQEDDLRRQESAEISRAFKLLAMELRVPIVVVCGLGHGPENRARAARPPELEELSGIDEDADVVIVLHRPDYYDAMSPRAGEADLIIRKHRDGPTDTVTVAAQLHICRFVDLIGMSGSDNYDSLAPSHEEDGPADEDSAD
jgi:replicative DNA helicase